MSKEVVPPAFTYTDEDQKNLKQLIETFGTTVSLKEITSAYCKAGQDLQSTADLLCNMHGIPFDLPASNSHKSANIPSIGPSSNQYLGNGNNSKIKPKKSSASLGTVSNVIGKEYITPRPQPVQPCEKRKSVILSSDIPASEIWVEERDSAENTRGESMDKDLEEFVYTMLGHGFGLDKNVIHEVIGLCGYNMQISIDKLLDLSTVTTEKSKEVASSSSNSKMENGFGTNSRLSGIQQTLNGYSGRSKTDVTNGNDLILPKSEKNKKDIQREVLEALFTVPDRVEEKPKLKGPGTVDENSPYIVTKPPDETIVEDFTFITRQAIGSKNEESETTYEELRKSVTEYWLLMKDYYKAAVDAFGKKDYVKAQKLMEDGHFFMRKAREADDKSTNKLIESRNENEEVSLNMYHFEPREALRSFRLHLKSLSGLPTTHYLKAVIGTEGGGKKDKRRKNLITELLDNEGIPWTEEGNGMIISVRIDIIDPTKLSFAKK